MSRGGVARLNVEDVMKMGRLTAGAVALALMSIPAGGAFAQSKPKTSGKVEYLRAAGSEPAVSAPSATGTQTIAKRSRKKK